MNKDIARVISSIRRNKNRYGADPILFMTNGKTQITDGARLLRTEEAGFYPETDRELYKTASWFEPIMYDGEIIETPTYKELREKRDEEKLKYRMKTGKRSCDKRVVYRFKNGYTLNIDYLMDGIKATGSTKFVYSGNRKPCLFKSENQKTDYLLCPINNATGETTEGVYLID